MNKNLKLADAILSLLTSGRLLHKEDLIFALNQFVEAEEYEKCELVKDAINKENYSLWADCLSCMYSGIQKRVESLEHLLHGYDELPEEKKSTLRVNEMKKLMESAEETFWNIIDEMQSLQNKRIK